MMKEPYTCSACKYAEKDMCSLTLYKPTFEEWYEERPKICPWSNTANKSPTFTCELVRGDELAENPYCKSYEGAMEIVTSFPDYFEDGTADKGIDYCKITLHCYVLGSGRHHDFIGKNFKEALDKFERQICDWEEVKP